jgi:hypothetical protein
MTFHVILFFQCNTSKISRAGDFFFYFIVIPMGIPIGIPIGAPIGAL